MKPAVGRRAAALLPPKGARGQFVIFWAWMTAGAVLSWLWRSLVPWVTFMSWYAIVVSHWTAYLAKRAELAAEEGAEIADLVKTIEALRRDVEDLRRAS